MKQLTLWTCLVALGCANQQSPNSNGSSPAPEDPTSRQLAEANARLERGEIDEALLLADEVLSADSDNREALLLAAEGTIRIAQSGRSGRFFEEAESLLDEALDLDRDDPETVLRLSWVKKNLGKFESGANLAVEAANLLRGRNAPTSDIQGALLLAVDHQIQLLADTRRAVEREEFDKLSDESRHLAGLALGTIQSIEDMGDYPPARIRASRVHQWVGRYNDAVTALTTGVRDQPESIELHAALESLYLGLGQPLELASAYDSLVGGSGGGTATLFYAGRAQSIKGNHLRNQGNLDQAARAYRQAQTYFEDFLTREPGDINAKWWVASMELSRARVALEQGDYAQAETHYVRAVHADSRVLPVDEDAAPEILDGFGGTYLGGIARLGEALAASTDPDAQKHALDLFERFLSRHDEFGFAYNNAAFAAREWGSALQARAERAEADGNPEMARRLRADANAAWERSYELYENAVELWPEDARTANDAGLMLIYHLNRDFDRARQLFDRAIELGESQLAALPEHATQDERQNVEEAIGDAYQNIGKMLVENLGRPAEAGPFLQRSLEFFPYNGRSDARRLLSRMRDAVQDPQDRERERLRQEKLKTVIAEAEAEAARGNLDAALRILDAVGGQMAGLAPFHYRRGLYQARLARESGNGFLFQDARTDLERAVTLDRNPIPPRLEFAKVLFELGEFKARAEQSRELLSQARKQGVTDQETLAAVHEIRAKSAARAYVEARQAGESGEPLLDEARDSFRAIESQALADATLRSLWSTLEAWAGAPAAAFGVVVRAFAAGQADIGELVESAKQHGQSQAVIDRLADAEDPTLMWWRGRARYDRSYQLWASGEAQSAGQTADSAIADFRRSMAAEKSYRESCEQWIALCLGRRGTIELSSNRVEDACETFLEALETRADQAQTVIGPNQSIYNGVLQAADRPMQAGERDVAYEVFARASALLPEDVTLANNAGFSAREHALALARAGDETTARQWFDKSYTAYTRATQIAPDDLRVRNDRALILVYYLDRDLDLAKELLDSTIAEGQAQLDEMGDSTPEAERQTLSEIVGDAWGNLGFYWLNRRENLDEAEKAYRKSLDYYSPSNRAAERRSLQRIEAARRRAGGGDEGGR